MMAKPGMGMPPRWGRQSLQANTFVIFHRKKSIMLLGRFRVSERHEMDHPVDMHGSPTKNSWFDVICIDPIRSMGRTVYLSKNFYHENPPFMTKLNIPALMGSVMGIFQIERSNQNNTWFFFQKYHRWDVDKTLHHVHPWKRHFLLFQVYSADKYMWFV